MAEFTHSTHTVFKSYHSVLTLPYLTGKVCYCLALRPLVGPMHVPDLTLKLLKLLGVFSKLQE